MALTDSSIKALKPKDRRYKVFDGNGLYIEVHPSGSKVWRVKYAFNGKDIRYTIGQYPIISLKTARTEAINVKERLACGADPAEEKKRFTATEVEMFQALAEDWIEKQSARWSQEHKTTVATRLSRYAYPHIGGKRIGEITPPDVLRFVRMIEGKGKNETASRVLGICSQVFRYGVSCGICLSDPCRDLRGALTAHVESPRPALTSPDDVGGLMASILGYQGSSTIRNAMLWSAYTFCRPGEIRRAEWSEIVWDKKEWRIPAEKMKMRFEHRVPLARQCMEILEALREKRLSEIWIFPGPRPSRPLSENGVLSALRRMGYEKHEMTAHGFRAMASTLLNELGYRPDIIERQLAHGDTDKVRAVYNRAAYMNERRIMMQEWADHLDWLVASRQIRPVSPGIRG
jgi:integrase